MEWNLWCIQKLKRSCTAKDGKDMEMMFAITKTQSKEKMLAITILWLSAHSSNMIMMLFTLLIVIRILTLISWGIWMHLLLIQRRRIEFEGELYAKQLQRTIVICWSSLLSTRMETQKRLSIEKVLWSQVEFIQENRILLTWWKESSIIWLDLL